MFLKETKHRFWASILIFTCLIAGSIVTGDIESDKKVLLNLKEHMQLKNDWNSEGKSPCKWSGISCDKGGNHVTAIDLSNKNIMGLLFHNFSGLPQLQSLNLSENSICGTIPNDLGKCRNLRALNLSNNIIRGEFNIEGLDNLEVLDLSYNRFHGSFKLMFPAESCRNLMFLKLSSNRLSGSVDDLFNLCRNLHSLDLGSNSFRGNLSFRIDWLVELSMSFNSLGGVIPSWVFSENCSLRALDLSVNFFMGQLPKEISNCKNLVTLNLSGNKFSGKIPYQVGSLLSLQSFLLSGNDFSREVPDSLAEMRNLSLLDLSRNGFGRDVQEVFGRLHQVKYLILSGNSYVGGLFSSGILKLQSVFELDLSDNEFSGPLPTDISKMLNLKMLVLADNQFTGNIPYEYGYLSELQVLDLSFNKLSGSIPSSFGNLSSILWLMLANNSLTGEIPSALGNCSSLFWLNLANNRLSGPIPPETFNIGTNATAQLVLLDRTASGFQCKTLMRWIPTTNSPLHWFISYAVNRCEMKWDTSLRRYPLSSTSTPSSSWLKFVSGYIQLRGNKLSGELPSEISKMQSMGALYLDDNALYGGFPPEIGLLPLLLALNVSRNIFSGGIPKEIGMLKSLQSLDLSCNNFSGVVPSSLLNLTDLYKFNISYNPHLYGRIPSTGQLATFDSSSFLGNPLLELPFGTENRTRTSPSVPRKDKGESQGLMDRFVFAFLASYPFFFVVSFLGFLFLGSEKISPLKTKKKIKRRRKQRR